MVVVVMNDFDSHLQHPLHIEGGGPRLPDSGKPYMPATSGEQR